jgi:hypothetical protein
MTEARARRAAVLGATALLLLVHGWLVLPAHDYLLSDTYGYLADARYLAGKAGATWQGPSPYYHFGWALLVAPLYLVSDAPRVVQLGALGINALLATAVLPVGYLVGRRLFQLAPPHALAAGAVAATYPAVLLLGGYEWSESLFQLLFLCFALAAARLWERTSTVSAVVVAGLAAWLYATHPRGLGIVVVTAIALFLLGWRDQRAWIGLVVLVLLVAAVRLLDHIIVEAIYDPSSSAMEGNIIRRLREPRLLWGSVKAGIGQLWYLSVATLGLVPIGLVWLVTQRRLPRPPLLMLLGALAAVFAASALFMSDGIRVDHWVYGRYLEGVVPLLLVAGVAAVVTTNSRRMRWFFALVGFVGALALLLAGLRDGHVLRGGVMPLNVTGILAYRARPELIDVAKLTVIALVLIALVAALCRWRRLAGVALVVVVFTGAAATAQDRTLRPYDERWAGYSAIPQVVNRLTDDGAVTYLRSAYKVEPANLYQLELADRGVRFADDDPDTDLVIASSTWRGAGARLVYVEPTGPFATQALWVMRGALQDRLVRRGTVLPEELTDPLPAAARRQHVQAEVPKVLHGEQKIAVTLTHTGGARAWARTNIWPGAVDGTVQLEAWWLDGDREVAKSAAWLERVLLPGDSTTVTIRLTPPPPGRYQLRIGAVQVGIQRLPDPLEVTVEVR